MTATANGTGPRSIGRKPSSSLKQLVTTYKELDQMSPVPGLWPGLLSDVRSPMSPTSDLGRRTSDPEGPRK